MENTSINIVWFKRDLRFTDHEALFEAQKSGLPLLLIYCFEPSMMAFPDADNRHWRFVHESLVEMNERLKGLNAQLFVFHNEALTVFTEISKNYSIVNIFSHQEVGNRLSYDRDIEVGNFCKKEGIIWHEYQLNGVIRKLKSRKTWEAKWEKYMADQPKLIPEENWDIIKLDEKLYKSLRGNELGQEITTRNKNFQEGGEYWAWRYLKSFLNERYTNYSKNISKPALARKSCSRPTQHEWNISAEKKQISYSWKKNNKWNSILINASNSNEFIEKGSFEEYILEHYFGYTKASETKTIEYRINHPNWQINQVIHSKINCNFNEMDGDDFGFLNNENPKNIMLAVGSGIVVEWKRKLVEF